MGSATNISGAVLCGVLVDSCGPRGGILTGLVLIMAAWMPKVWAALGLKWTYSLVIKPDNGNVLGALSHRRKFRSQTSDNMDRWKKQRWEESETRREENKREDQRRERVRREKMQVCEKVECFSNDLWLRRVEK